MATSPQELPPPSEIIEDTIKLSDAINTYGSAVILLAFFLIVFIAIICVMLKQNISNQRMLREQNQILTSTILEINQSKPKSENKDENPRDTKTYDEKSIVSIFVKLNRTFKFECKKYLERVDADRIGIYVFHNGTVASHGLPFFKVSCICEWIRRGSAIPPHISDTTGIPLNLFDDVIENLYTNGVTVVCNNPNNTNPNYMKSDSFYLDSDEVECSVFIPVYDKDDNIFAMIMVEYKNMVEQENLDRYVVDLEDFCHTIRPTLEFSEYQCLNTPERG